MASSNVLTERLWNKLHTNVDTMSISFRILLLDTINLNNIWMVKRLKQCHLPKSSHWCALLLLRNFYLFQGYNLVFYHVLSLVYDTVSSLAHLAHLLVSLLLALILHFILGELLEFSSNMLAAVQSECQLFK